MTTTITESQDINTILHWAMGRRVRYPGGPVITQDDATAAAKRLAARAYKALSAGLRPEDVDLTRDDEPDGIPACRVCGCTEERPCPGGCEGVPDPKMLGDLCSRCEPILSDAGLL